ncbi:MAG: glycosyltransferase family 2 protein, partial [Phycisphaerae bacterium]
MTVLAVTLTAIAAAVALVWASRHLMIWRETNRGFLLTPDCPGPPADPPPVSVMIAARNEADCIEACVRTMLDQDYPNFELLVCNDRSTDDTAAIVERIAAEDGRLRLMNIELLPDGWCGKNNAMQRGIATTGGEWICMGDADCRQLSRRTLSTAVQYALDNRCDLLSVLPRLEMRSFWENVVQPVGSGVMMIWFHPDKVNDPARPNAYANGAFILIRREAYQAIGTHEAVKDCFNEDMHMARLVKEGGMNLRVVRSSGLYLVRMYTSLRQSVRGWSRIFYGTFGTLRRLSISLGVMVVMGLLPYVAAGLGLGMLAGGATP